MKKILVLFLLIPLISYSQYSNDYKEINIGIYNDGKFRFPGVSFLYGRTIFYNNSTLLDYQLGAALPSIITCKVGYGIGDDFFSFITGVRPWPTTMYLQLNIKRLSFSFEPLLTYPWTDEGLFSNSLKKGVVITPDILGTHLITFGYRF